jgi:hypothetical protein
LSANHFFGDEFPSAQNNKAEQGLDLKTSASRASLRKYCLWDGSLAAEPDAEEGKTVVSRQALSKNNSSSRSDRSLKVKRKRRFSFQKSLSLNPAPVLKEREEIPEDEMDFSMFGTEEKLVEALTAFFSGKLPSGKIVKSIRAVSNFFFKNETAFKRLCHFVAAMRGLSQNVLMWYSEGEIYLFNKYCEDTQQFKVKEETARFHVGYIGTKEKEILSQRKKALGPHQRNPR